MSIVWRGGRLCPLGRCCVACYVARLLRRADAEDRMATLPARWAARRPIHRRRRPVRRCLPIRNRRHPLRPPFRCRPVLAGSPRLLWPL